MILTPRSSTCAWLISSSGRRRGQPGEDRRSHGAGARQRVRAPGGSGRVPDTCRRVLGLPTSPPDADPQVLWGLIGSIGRH